MQPAVHQHKRMVEVDDEDETYMSVRGPQCSMSPCVLTMFASVCPMEQLVLAPKCTQTRRWAYSGEPTSLRTRLMLQWQRRSGAPEQHCQAPRLPLR